MALAEVISRKQQLEDRNRELQADLDRPVERTASGALDMTFERARSYYRLRIERELSRISQQLSDIESELDSARQVFSEKRKERKVLERLRELRESEHYRLEHKREESELNDIIGSRAARVNASGGTQWQGDTIA